VSRRRFTLIEILIVVTLIGVLASLALPNLLEAEAQAEASRLLTQVSQIRVAWTELLAGGQRSLADPELYDVGPAPAPLVPLLPELRHESKEERSYLRDASGRLIPDPSDPSGYKSETVHVPLLIGAGGVHVSTCTVRPQTQTSLRPLGLGAVAVRVQLNAHTAHGRKVLELALPHWREAGYAIQITDLSRIGSFIVYIYPPV
jgi:prepilin-type N-terminal cleavage/methylation domain-containing protein